MSIPVAVLGQSSEIYTTQEVDNLLADVGGSQQFEGRVAALEASVGALTTTQDQHTTKIAIIDNQIASLEASMAAAASQLALLETALATKVEGLNGVAKLWGGTAAQADAIQPRATDTIYIGI
jgi:chromosome segregation ATPase